MQTPRPPRLRGGWPVRAGGSRLAPRVYEGGGPLGPGGVHTTLHLIINYSTNTVKIFIYISITEPNYFQSVIFQDSCSKCIFSLTFRIIMSTTIQLDHQLCTEAVKVSNIFINTLLPLKANGIILQKAIPKFPLPWSHIFTELFCSDFIFLIVFHTYFDFSPPRLRGRYPEGAGESV